MNSSSSVLLCFLAGTIIFKYILRHVFSAVSCAAGHHLRGHYQRVSFVSLAAVSSCLHKAKG